MDGEGGGPLGRLVTEIGRAAQTGWAQTARMIALLAVAAAFKHSGALCQFLPAGGSATHVPISEAAQPWADRPADLYRSQGV